MELAEELWEVVEEEEEEAEGALVQQAYRIRQLRVAQKGLQEAQLHQHQLQVGAPAAVGGRGQQARHQPLVGHQLEPGEGKGGGLEGAGGVQKGSHGLREVGVRGWGGGEGKGG